MLLVLIRLQPFLTDVPRTWADSLDRLLPLAVDMAGCSHRAWELCGSKPYTFHLCTVVSWKLKPRGGPSLCQEAGRDGMVTSIPIFRALPSSELVPQLLRCLHPFFLRGPPHTQPSGLALGSEASPNRPLPHSLAALQPAGAETTLTSGTVRAGQRLLNGATTE